MKTKNLYSNIPANKYSGKSVQDLTPFELSQIDQFQNKNRGFDDEDEKDWSEEMEDMNHAEYWGD